MLGMRIRQIIIKCRGDQAQVRASALIDNDTFAVNPNKSIFNEWQQGFKFLHKRFTVVIDFFRDLFDVADKIAHQLLDNATADPISE